MRDLLQENNDDTGHHERDLLLTVLGHDLRNPLSSILGGLDLLRAGRLDERERVRVEKLHLAALRMSRIIDQLLDFGRSQLGGGIRLERSLVDLGDVSAQVIGELDAAGKATISLERLGDTSGLWDRDGLARVISNLVGNALAHGDHTSVALIVDGRSDDVVITCHNTGPAIAAETLSHLFDPFTRGARSSGLGLGLHIVVGIVEAHGGRIMVHSTAGGGTTFYRAGPLSKRIRQSFFRTRSPQTAPPIWRQTHDNDELRCGSHGLACRRSVRRFRETTCPPVSSRRQARSTYGRCVARSIVRKIWFKTRSCRRLPISNRFSWAPVCQHGS